jgi:hypothetical protein
MPPLLHDIFCFFEKIPTSLVIFISACVALYSIKQARTLHIQKNTIDFDAAHANNDKLLDAYAFLNKLTSNRLTVEYGLLMTDYASTKKATTEAASLRLILNTWERIGRGIENKIYDEDILYKALKSTALIIYKKTGAFRAETQKGRPTCFEYFETLATRWEKRYNKEGGDSSSFY